MRVFLIRDHEENVVEGIFWANSVTELRHLLNAEDEPGFYQYCELTGPAGLISISDADPDAMLQLAPDGNEGADLGQYAATDALNAIIASQTLTWWRFSPFETPGGRVCK